MNGDRLGNVRLRTGRAILFLFLVVWHQANAAEPLEEVSEHVYPLDPDGSVSLQAMDGSVLLYGNERPEVSIKTIKKAYSQDRFKDININVKNTPKEVAIETSITPRKKGLGLIDRSGTVDYVVIVPQSSRISKIELVNGELLIAGVRGGSVTAHLVNGLMTVYDCFENADLATVNGRVELVYNWWEDKKFSLKISNSQGQIRTRFPPDASVRVMARTITGGIVNALAGQSNPSEPVRSLDFTTTANPATSCELNSTNGNIRVEKTY